MYVDHSQRVYDKRGTTLNRARFVFIWKCYALSSILDYFGDEMLCTAKFYKIGNLIMNTLEKNVHVYILCNF